MANQEETEKSGNVWLRRIRSAPNHAMCELSWRRILVVAIVAFIFIQQILTRRSDPSPHDKKAEIPRCSQEAAERGALFYTAYTHPTDKEQSSRAREIIGEQLTMLMYSWASNLTVHYSLIGDVDAKLPFCGEKRRTGRIKCNELEKVPEGTEFVTLQHLWDYCLWHPSAIVGYFHDMESLFDEEGLNERLRSLNMRSLFLNDGCAKAVESGQCTMCGARFSPGPTYHMPGNMWWGSCSYIRKLVPPTYFSDIMMNMWTEMREIEKQSDKPIMGPTALNFDPIDGRPELYGIGRHGAESWPMSHPSMIPCDVLPKKYEFMGGSGGLPKKTDSWDFELLRSPVYTWEHFKPHVSLDGSGDWLGLKGRLYYYEKVYNEVPSSDSWIWKYYTLGNVAGQDLV